MTATTITGTGVLPKVVRSLLHPLLVHQALTHGWPITNEQAAAELLISKQDILEIAGMNLGILGDGANEAINTWIDSTDSIHAAVNLQATAAPDAAADETVQHQIEIHYQAAFDLLAALDFDLIGIRSDAGTTP